MWHFYFFLGCQPPLKSVYPGSCRPKKLFLGRFFLENHFFGPFLPDEVPKCYTWLESCGSHLSGGVCVWFSRTLCTDIFLYTEKLSYPFLPTLSVEGGIFSFDFILSNFSFFSGRHFAAALFTFICPYFWQFSLLLTVFFTFDSFFLI